MSRILVFSLWFAFALLIVGSSHYYIWARLVRDTELSAPWSVLTTTVVVLLGFSMPAALVLARLMAAGVGKALLTVAFTWMGVFFLIFVALLAGDVGRITLAALYELQGIEVPAVVSERRLLLTRLLAGGLVTAALAASVVAFRTVRAGPAVVRVPVGLARLPAALDGFTIAQISDLHVGPLIGRSYVEELVRRTNALEPHMVVITGDLVDGSVAQLHAAVAPLAELRAPHGTFFVTGNHEYYSGVVPWLRHLTELGIRVLRNERVSIGEVGASFDLAGVDDITAYRFGGGHGANLRRALRHRDPTRELVLLAHQPRAIFEAAELGVGLMLSGHTHGGQIWPFGYLVKLLQPFIAGLGSHGPTQIYVNRGTGFWGPPMRLGAPPELTLLTLYSRAASLAPTATA